MPSSLRSPRSPPATAAAARATQGGVCPAGSLLGGLRGSYGHDDLRDALALDHQPGITRLDGDEVLLQVDDPSHDAAGGDDLVAPLEALQQVGVLLLLLALRAQQQEPEDRDQREDLDRDHDERTAALAAGRGGEEGEERHRD